MTFHHDVHDVAETRRDVRHHVELGALDVQFERVGPVFAETPGAVAQADAIADRRSKPGCARSNAATLAARTSVWVAVPLMP
jgi:hypothetical protein